MGLMAFIRRKSDTAYWRLRYWWFDTPGGAHAHVAGLVLGCLVLIAQVVRMAASAYLPKARPAPQEAIYWWVIQLVIMVVAAIVAYALRPKVEQQKPQEANPPSTEDGQAVIDILGTGWVPDYFWLAWKPNGVEKIKAKGKK